MEKIAKHYLQPIVSVVSGILAANLDDDEIAGLFNSLGQFSKGEDESLQILLKLWDAAALCVDRTIFN